MTANLKLAVLAGAVSRGISILLRILSVPLTVSLLTTEEYGLWMILSSIIIWFGFSDLGIPSALQNRLVTILQSGDAARARVLVAYALRTLLLIAGAAFVLAAAFVWAIPWEKLWRSDSIQRTEFNALFLLCLGTFALGLPSRIGGAILSAHGWLYVLPLSELIAQVGAFAMLLIAVFFQWKSLLVMVGCILISVAAVPAVTTALALWRLHYPPGLREAPVPSDRHALLGKGGFFFLTAIGELFILQSDPLLIGYVLGAAAVPLFMLPTALFINFLQAQNIFLRPLWPILSRYQADRNSAAFAQLVRRMLFGSLVGSVLFATALLLAGDWFIRFWSKGVAALPPTMAIGFAAYVVAASIDNILATVLNAVGMIEQRFGYTLLFGATKLLLGWVVLVRVGIEGLPMTYAAIMCLTSIPFASFWVYRAVRRISD